MKTFPNNIASGLQRLILSLPFMLFVFISRSQETERILILRHPENFADYTAEILKTEGFGNFRLAELNDSNIRTDQLLKFQIVILPKSTLTATQVKSLVAYVKNGGQLIVFSPQKELYSLAGLKYSPTSNETGYLTIAPDHEAVRGLLQQPLQLHELVSAAERVGAKTLATLSKGDRKIPAITENEFGKGRVISFLYNLPANILWTRQGNPALAGKETDGINGIRAMDLFTGGWIDANQNSLNQADEQMRLLTHCIEWMNGSRAPQPRFWYFPNQLNALIALTNDGENSLEKDFVQQFREVSEKGARMTLYILEPEKISKRFVDSLSGVGHEMAAHPDATAHASSPSWQIVDSAIGAKFGAIKKLYGIDKILTNTNHWFVWCGLDENGKPDFSAGAKIEALHGVVMDVNYAHYDNNSNQGHFLGSTGWMQGNYTGSGLPMRFADEKGKPIDVYQLFNNIYDQQYMETKDQEGYYLSFRGILDRSLDSGIYSVACIRAHNNEYFFSRDPLLKILDYANQRRVPVWTVTRLMGFVVAREDAKISQLVWKENQLRFSIKGSIRILDSLSCMIPVDHLDLKIGRIEYDDSAVNFTVRKIKGTSYAMFNVPSSGSHRVIVRYDKFLAGHRLVLDKTGKILPWNGDPPHAYDAFLRKRWEFIFNHVPPGKGKGGLSRFPPYYFYCAYDLVGDSLKPNEWMNDVGEKIPNWFESARLYYTYSGDSTAMHIVREMTNYQMTHGLSPSNFAWPNFPFANANAGDSIFDGFTSAKRFNRYETQVDHSGEIGLTYLNLYLFYGEKRYLDAAIDVADLLTKKVREGSKEKSPWPYLVNAQTGKSRSEYGANWTGCYSLLKKLADLKLGNYSSYLKVCVTVRDFLQDYPLKTGYWTDGHSDTYINSSTYKSNLSASNYKLFLFDHPEFDPDWKKSVPSLIDWTEKNFVDRSAPGEKGRQWGANIVGEQDSFLYKMDYQTARYAAECARWYAASGEVKYKEKAYRALNFVTYCSDSIGLASESPLSKGIASWWSDCYGEGPRMFYQVFSALPEWSPPGENHILYAAGILRDVVYKGDLISYQASETYGVEYLHLNFKPGNITIEGKQSRSGGSREHEGFELKPLSNGDFYLKIFRQHAGRVSIGK